MGKKILVIEDEEDIRQLIVNRLKIEGYDVCEADNGLDGLEKARAETPDLIVCDVMLPQMDGFRLCRMLKFDDRFETIPFIFLTARGQESDWKTAEDVRADAYITKPFDGKVLSETIHRLLKDSSKDDVSG